MLKSCFVEGTTLDDVWFRLLLECYNHGRVNHITDGSFAGANRLEFDYVAGTIYHPTTRPLAPIMPSNTPPVTTDEKIEEYFINYLMDGKNLEGNEHYRYATWVTGGEYMLPHSIIDMWDGDEYLFGNGDGDWQVMMTVPNQLQWCMDHYKKKGFGNNHACIQVGYPESSYAYDIPWETEADRQTSPCLRLIDTHIKKDEGWKLCFHVVFRSWDLFAGWPENMGGITMLMEHMAGELGVEVGTLSFSSLKCHTYDFALEPLKLRLGVE